jgi:TetR/AcrR family transcriptional repressor of nem operon
MATAKSKMISSAKGLMLVNGYPSTSVDEIISAAGVSKGSFYHCFKSKEELGAAVAEAYLDEALAVIGTGRYEEVEDPLERAFAFVEHMEAAAPALWNHGCMLGSFAIDLSGTHSTIAACLNRLMDDLESRMAPLLEPIALACRQDDAPSGRELANHMMAVVEGGIVMAKAHGEPKRIAGAIHEFKRYLKALIK